MKINIHNNSITKIFLTFLSSMSSLTALSRVYMYEQPNHCKQLAFLHKERSRLELRSVFMLGLGLRLGLELYSNFISLRLLLQNYIYAFVVYFGVHQSRKRPGLTIDV